MRSLPSFRYARAALTFLSLITGAAFAGEPAPPSRPVLAIMPDYPTAAWIKGVGGSITVAFRLDPGAAGPDDLRVLTAEPRDVFDEAVVATLPHWRFRPGGDPKRCQSRIERGSVTFRFDAATEEVSVAELYVAGERVEFSPRFLLDEETEPSLLDEARTALSGPRFTERATADFPSEARRRHAEGLAVLGFRIDAKGRARDIEVLYARPRDTFEDASIDALEDSRLVVPTPEDASGDGRYCTVYRYGFLDKYRYELYLKERKERKARESSSDR